MNQTLVKILFHGVALTTATATYAQDLIVGDYFSNTVRRVAPDGTTTPFAQPSVPSGIRLFGSAFDATGNLYVARLEGATNNPGDPNNGVIRISPTGVVTNVVNRSGWQPSDIAFDLTGNLYVSSASSGEVRRFTPSGTDLGVFATVASDAYKLSTNAAGDLFVGSSGSGQIRRFSQSGVDLGLVGTFSNFRALETTANGELLAGSSDSTISRFTADGVSLGVFASVAGVQFSDIAVAPSGDVFAANYNGDVRRFSAAGTALGTLGTGFSNPSALAFAPSVVTVPEPSSL